MPVQVSCTEVEWTWIGVLDLTIALCQKVGKYEMGIAGWDDMSRRLRKQNCLGQKGANRMTVALS